MAEYKNLAQLMNELDQQGLLEGISDWFSELTGNGDKTLEAELYGKFYEQWSVYLSPMAKAWTHFLIIPEYVMRFLYNVSYSMETVFENMFKLFGFFNYFTDTKSFVGQFYGWMQTLGIAAFLFLFIGRVIISFFDVRLSYKDTINNLLMVTFAVSIIPTAIGSYSSLIADSTSKLMDHNVKGSASSLSIQPIQDHTVDMNVILENNFDIEKLGYQEQSGYLSSTDATVPLNEITDENFKSISFRWWYGAADEDTIDMIEEYAKENKNYEGAAFLLAHTYDGKTAEGYKIQTNNKSAWNSVKNLFIDVYVRFRVNWLALYFQQIILILILMAMSIKFVQTVMSVLITGMIAPIVGYTSVSDSSKFKELLFQIFGGITGIFFEVAILKVAMMMIGNLPNVSISSSSGNFFDGLGYWEHLIAVIFVYLGVYFGVVSGGSHMIERWLGVPSKQNHVSTAAGLIAGGVYAAKKTPSLAKGTYALGGAVGGAAVGAAQGIPKAIAKTAGVVGGTVSGLAEAGGRKPNEKMSATQVAKGIGATAVGAKDKLVEKAGDYAQSLASEKNAVSESIKSGINKVGGNVNDKVDEKAQSTTPNTPPVPDNNSKQQVGESVNTVVSGDNKNQENHYQDQNSSQHTTRQIVGQTSSDAAPNNNASKEYTNQPSNNNQPGENVANQQSKELSKAINSNNFEKRNQRVKNVGNVQKRSPITLDDAKDQF